MFLNQSTIQLMESDHQVFLRLLHLNDYNKFILPEALAIASDISGFNAYCLFTIAALFLSMPNALITGNGILSVSLAISKFYIDLYVYAPHNLSALTLIGPNVSDSSLKCEQNR